MKKYTIYANSTAWRLRGAITTISNDSWEPFVTEKTVIYEDFERIHKPNDEYRYFVLPASGNPWSLLKVHHSLVKETDDVIAAHISHPMMIDETYSQKVIEIWLQSQR